jgi:Fe-S cluster biosynthesis and repair protein YggX
MGCGSGMAAPKPPVTNKTGRKVFCVKFQKEMFGLDEVPFDGHPLGQKVFENVSKEAWGMWLEQMKMIMNEYRLNLGTREAQEFLLKQMEEYFWGAGSAMPPGYVPDTEKKEPENKA